MSGMHDPPAATPTVSVVTVAYGAEPWLERAVAACLASQGVVVDVVLVDNGCTDGALDRLRVLPGVTVVHDGSNVGFAEGCNIGVRAARGELIALVNPDALVAPDALALLAAAARPDDVGAVSASVRLADRPELLNAAGLSLHFTGISWAGHFEEPAARWAHLHDVIGPSGAGMLMRRDRWDELGGLCGDFFAYYEDCDLGVRTWLHGWRVVYVPDAVVHHRYEFSRNARKYFLVERNRLLLLLTTWRLRTLVLLAPVLVPFDIAVLALAAKQGWAREKLRSWGWVLRHPRFVRRRRREVQATRRCGDDVLVPLLEDVLDPGNFPLPPALAPLQWPARLWWRLVRRAL